MYKSKTPLTINKPLLRVSGTMVTDVALERLLLFNNGEHAIPINLYNLQDNILTPVDLFFIHVPVNVVDSYAGSIEEKIRSAVFEYLNSSNLLDSPLDNWESFEIV